MLCRWSAETKQPTVGSFVLFQFYFTMCDELYADILLYSCTSTTVDRPLRADDVTGVVHKNEFQAKSAASRRVVYSCTPSSV